ncbi:MAG: hypothetical protein GYB65_11515 [Chloroflexi bacterium]|nr:hypothetical protein [Chloroflexota bacterium]
MKRKYEAFDPQSEILGQTLFALFLCAHHDILRPSAKKHGLVNIEPEQWYPLSALMAVFNDLANGKTANVDFVSFGLTVAEVTPTAVERGTVPFEEALLRFATTSYQMVHRGEVGEQIVEKVGERHLKIISRTPYPDDFWIGLYYGIARQSLPPGSQLSLQFDETIPRQDEGGDVTVIHVTWNH